MSTWPLGGGPTAGDIQRGWPTGTAGLEAHARLSTSASANTFGAWVEFYSATPFDAVGFDLATIPQSGNAQHVFQVGIGAAGSEIVLFEVGVAGESFASGFKHRMQVPLNIPRGVRVAMRVQKSTATATTSNAATVMLIPRSTFRPLGFNGVEYVNQPSLSTSVVATTFAASNASSGTVGTITEISSGIVNNWKAFTITFGGTDTSNLANTNPGFALMLRCGASGNGDRIYGYTSVFAETRAVINHAIGPIACDLPAGSRLVLELLSNATSNGTTNRIRPTIQGYY